ncbi:hypothetical protein [Vibrio phage BONAISHI]|nr:hypothetical protein [Vibrio phage BONAISHI]
MHEDFEIIDLRDEQIASHIDFPDLENVKFTYDSNDDLYFIIGDECIKFYLSEDPNTDPLGHCEDDLDALEVISQSWGLEGAQEFAIEFENTGIFDLAKHDGIIIHYRDEHMTQELF